MLDFTSHPAFKEGLVTARHSIPGGRLDAIDPEKVKYLIVNRHGTDPNVNGGLGRGLPDQVLRHLPQDSEAMRIYLLAEQDAGIHDLCGGLLDALSGGVVLDVTTNRSVVDCNRVDVQRALTEILQPETPESVKAVLREMHAWTLRFIDDIGGQLPSDLRRFELHSMKPVTPTVPVNFTYDTVASCKAVYAHQYEGQRRLTDIITGTAGQAPVADMEVSRLLAELLKARGIQTGFNNPYDTDSAYPDYLAMVRWISRVTAVDHLKTDLCVGEPRKGGFDVTCPVVDEKKVQTMVEVYAEIFKKLGWRV